MKPAAQTQSAEIDGLPIRQLVGLALAIPQMKQPGRVRSADRVFMPAHVVAVRVRNEPALLSATDVDRQIGPRQL